MQALLQNKTGLKVLVTGCFIQLFLGILYVWSVFVRPISVFYDWDIESVKLTSSFMLSFFVVGILAGGRMQLKTGAAKAVLLGGLMLAGGMLITAFLPAGLIRLIYISYGVLGGFGVGAAYNAIISATQKHYPKNRGLATGITVCSFGFSTVIFAPLIETLIARFGLRNTFIILAAVFGAVIISLFRFIALPDDGTPGASAAPGTSQKQFTMSETIKTKQFYFITLSLMFATAAFFILNPSFKTLASERGLSDAAATAVVMLTGIANALGRLITPLLSDKIGRERAIVAIILATSVCTVALCFVSGALFMAAIAIVAFCYGGFSGTYPVLTADYFGLKHVGSNYGAVMAGFALSALTFPALVSLIGNMTARFVTLALLSALGAVLVVLLLNTNRKGDSDA